MGKVSHNSPGELATLLNAYLRWQSDARGYDPSGRQLEAVSNGQRKKGYWQSLLSNEKTMTINDLALVAEIFGVSPYQFVREARDWDPESSGDPDSQRGVGGPADTADEQLQSDYELAARKKSRDRGEDTY